MFCHQKFFINKHIYKAMCIKSLQYVFNDLPFKVPPDHKCFKNYIVSIRNKIKKKLSFVMPLNSKDRLIPIFC